MNKNSSINELNAIFVTLNDDIQKITKSLLNLVCDDEVWWIMNVQALVSQPLNILKEYLKDRDDSTLNEWTLGLRSDLNFPKLEPLEALIWLVSLCRIDKFFINRLPPRFNEEVELQWKVMALNWLH